MKLTADLIEAFAGVYLSPKYDSAQPTPDFHRACWKRYCSDTLACATAAPRNHAKSTSLTHDYILAEVCFRTQEYVILVGSSEDMAIEHLGDIAAELTENEELIQEFKIKGILTHQKTDIIVECADGHQFRIIARGAEQKIRGRKWRGKRPGLIVFDDIEDDEQVESRDRRRKFRRWFFRACKQSLRDGGKIRGHGTILHEDSLLNRLMKNKVWDSVLYKAHESFDDFTNILWPEKFPEARLRNIRQEFINEGDSAGYAQEYLNDPFDNEDIYLRPEDFHPMKEEDHDVHKLFGAAVDFAISKADAANRTSITVGGKDSRNLVHVVDQRTGRWDASEIIDEMFSVQEKWDLQWMVVEKGQIWLALKSVILAEILRRDRYMNLIEVTPVKDKKARGRAFQKRHKSGGCRFDKETSWYPGYEAELLRFTGNSEAVLDDQFDSTAHLMREFEEMRDVEDSDSLTNDENEFLEASEHMRKHGGRSLTTGY